MNVLGFFFTKEETWFVAITAAWGLLMLACTVTDKFIGGWALTKDRRRPYSLVFCLALVLLGRISGWNVGNERLLNASYVPAVLFGAFFMPWLKSLKPKLSMPHINVFSRRRSQSHRGNEEEGSQAFHAQVRPS